VASFTITSQDDQSTPLPQLVREAMYCSEEHVALLQASVGKRVRYKSPMLSTASDGVLHSVGTGDRPVTYVNFDGRGIFLVPFPSRLEVLA